ncbi:tyrosinase family protein [Sorangium sp. So ce1128]
MTLVALSPSSSYAACPTVQDEPSDCRPLAPTCPAVRFQGDLSGMFTRVRKSVYDLTPYEIDRLRYAFDAIRRLSIEDPSDPRGWFEQAKAHCWHCGGLPDAETVDIHHSYYFLPWHRAYLYFYEKILGSLIGDPEFALPYWDWDTEGRRFLPPLYIEQGDQNGNPLFDATRREKTKECMPEARVSTKLVNDVMNLTDWQEFMGKPPGARQPGPIPPPIPGVPTDPRAAYGGRLEIQMHNSIHGWIPKRAVDPSDPKKMCPSEHMGIFSTSAQDPIFFAHHANIDRLWENWWRAGGAQRLPPDNEWRQQTWSFYDENKQLVEISVEQVIDTIGSLGYAYMPPSHADLSISCEQPPAQALLNTSMLSSYAPPLVQLPGESQELTTAPRTVAAPVEDFSAIGYLGDPAQQLAQPVSELRIDDIQLEPGETVTVDIFVGDLSTGVQMSENSPNYVGYFTIIPSHSGGHGGGMSMLGQGSTHRHGTYNIALSVNPQTQQLAQQMMAAPALAKGAFAAAAAQPTIPVTLAVWEDPSQQALTAQYGAMGAAAAPARPVLRYGRAYFARN